MIECVTIENNHAFFGNPLCSQHKLRYKSVIERQQWEVPYVKDMEYDSYDNPAAHYLIHRNSSGAATGVARLYPTTRPYMIEEHFPYLITKREMPKTEKIWETTRFCVESSLPPDQRKKILHEIVVGHLEFALDRQIESIIAITYPAIWRTIFIDSGWPAEWLGNVHKSKEGLKIVAGNLKVSEKVLENVRKITGIDHKILDYGKTKNSQIAA